MALRQKMRGREKAVYWPPSETPTTDDFGNPVVCVAPCEIRCRWQEKKETKVSVEGTTYTRVAFVYPDEPLAQGGFLARGPVSALTGPINDPKANKAREIVIVEEFPGIRLGEQLDKVWIGEAT